MVQENFVVSFTLDYKTFKKAKWVHTSTVSKKLTISKSTNKKANDHTLLRFQKNVDFFESEAGPAADTCRSGQNLWGLSLF